MDDQNKIFLTKLFPQQICENSETINEKTLDAVKIKDSKVFAILYYISRQPTNAAIFIYNLQTKIQIST